MSVRALEGEATRPVLPDSIKLVRIVCDCEAPELTIHDDLVLTVPMEFEPQYVRVPTKAYIKRYGEHAVPRRLRRTKFVEVFDIEVTGYIVWWLETASDHLAGPKLPVADVLQRVPDEERDQYRPARISYAQGVTFPAGPVNIGSAGDSTTLATVLPLACARCGLSARLDYRQLRSVLVDAARPGGSPVPLRDLLG